MDKRMHLREELVGMANSSANQEYHGEQEVRSSDKETDKDPLENVPDDCGQNVTSLLELSEISNRENKDEMTHLENAKNEEMEHVITENSSPEIYEVIATENGSRSGSDVHVCKRCGKSFSNIISLNGHMGCHQREDYKLIRQILEEPVPVENSQTMAMSLPIPNNKKKPKLKHIWEASMGLTEMSKAHFWHPKHGNATKDISASVICSSDEHCSDEAAKMREVAEFLTIMWKKIQEECVKVPSTPSVCKICNKSFSSYHALGGHMSIHNKHKSNLLEDGAGSSTGNGVHSTYVCTICNEKFPNRKSLNGHKRKHYHEENKKTASTDGNGTQPIQLAQEPMQSSGLMVLPTNKNMTFPMLLSSNGMQPTRSEKVVANASLHQALSLPSDATQLPQQSDRLGTDTELCSGILDLNLLQHDNEDHEP